MAASFNCFDCEKSLPDPDARHCPHCGVNRTAPVCIHCESPVTSDKNVHAYHGHENGHYAWHHRWNGRCESCGHEFRASVRLRTGHGLFFHKAPALLKEWGLSLDAGDYSGVSEVSIEGDESTTMHCDEWDHQPTIRVSVRRAVPSNAGPAGGGLAQEASIAMTPLEWRAVIDQLQGPLSVLMERQPWSRDTT
jgi:hypothetical protein